MKAFIRNRSTLTEFCFIVMLWIGVTLISRITNLVKAFGHSSSPLVAKTVHITDSGILWQAVWELFVLVIAWWISRVRGWSFKPFVLRPAWNWTAAGIALFSISGWIYWSGRLLLNWIYPTAPSGVHIVSELTLPIIALIVIINPIFEESFWEGYLFQALQRHGMWVTVLTSALLRTLCHAHLGMKAIITILPMGLAYGLIYWRWRQLWPLVVAHALEMSFSLLRMSYQQRTAFSESSYEMSWLFAELAAILICLLLAWRSRKRTILKSA